MQKEIIAHFIACTNYKSRILILCTSHYTRNSELKKFVQLNGIDNNIGLFSIKEYAIKYPNDSIVEFAYFDNVMQTRSIVRDAIFYDENNNIEDKIFQNIKIRSKLVISEKQ